MMPPDLDPHLVGVLYGLHYGVREAVIMKRRTGMAPVEFEVNRFLL